MFPFIAWKSMMIVTIAENGASKIAMGQDSGIVS